MPPTNCIQANQSAGNGSLASGSSGSRSRSWCLASHYVQQQQHYWSTGALTRVSAPQKKEQIRPRQRTGSRLARRAGGRIGAQRIAPTGSTPNELTMCRGRQVYDYICIDCDWAKSWLSCCSLSAVLSLLLLLLPLFLSLPLSWGCCLLEQSGAELLLLAWLSALECSELNSVSPTAPRDAHLEAPPPIISVLLNQSCAGKGLFGARGPVCAGNRIIPCSTLDTTRIHQHHNNQPDTNVKCKRHRHEAANLRGSALHSAHYDEPRTRCCHYSISRGLVVAPGRLGVSEGPSQPRPTRVASRSAHSRARPTTTDLLCVLFALLLLNVGARPQSGSRQELAKGQPSIMWCAAASTVVEHRFTRAPEIADKSPSLGALPPPVFRHRVGHRNERALASGQLGRHKQQQQQQQRHSSHAERPPSSGPSLIGGGFPSSGLGGNLLLLPWGQSASGSQHLESGACAPGCVCLWKNGKQAADCSQTSHEQQQHRLAGLPVGLDPLTQVLNLTGQPLVELAAGAFASLQLTNLQRIHLAKCQLSLIHAQAFERLKLLVELDLSWNQLKVVPVPSQSATGAPSSAASASQMHLLRRLVMRGNPLGALEERTLLPANELIGGPPSSSPSRAPIERLLETYPELGPLLASSSELALAKLASEAPSSAGFMGGASRTGTQVVSERDQLWAQLEAALEAADRGAAEWAATREARKGLLAAHFPQIQELDFGECQLSYIKWNVFAHLNQLKRLLLDGNQLSQLSGQLVRLLPVNLHQLALEGNPLVCDCRAQTLARWLASSRIPLSSPVRCQQQQQLPGSLHPRLPMHASTHHEQGRTGKSLGTSSSDELPDDELVCAPRPIEALKLAAELSPTPLHLLIHYLWPTLIRNSQELNESRLEGGPGQPTSETGSPAKPHKPQMLQVREGDKLALRCPLLAYPEWSVQFVWLVEYGAKVPAQPLSAGQLPAEERLLVLYDSRLLSRSARFGANGNFSQHQMLVSEQATHGARFLVREARLQLESAFVESEMIIESALPADSGRYKCMGLNKAGNASLEFLVRVRPQRQSLADLESLPHSPQEQQQPPLAKSTLAPISQQGGGNPKLVSKGSATVQVTMVLVSALMGAVIVAFVLFCVLIYQIKPSSATGSLDGRRLEESLPEVGSRQHSPATNLRAHLVPTTVHCDPRTGQSVAVHLAASPASSLTNLTLGPPASVHSLAVHQPLVGVRRKPEATDYQQPAPPAIGRPLVQNPRGHHLGQLQPTLVNAWQPVALL